jgi:hypothetical protein
VHCCTLALLGVVTSAAIAQPAARSITFEFSAARLKVSGKTVRKCSTGKCELTLASLSRNFGSNHSLGDPLVLDNTHTFADCGCGPLSAGATAEVLGDLTQVSILAGGALGVNSWGNTYAYNYTRIRIVGEGNVVVRSGDATVPGGSHEDVEIFHVNGPKTLTCKVVRQQSTRAAYPELAPWLWFGSWITLKPYPSASASESVYPELPDDHTVVMVVRDETGDINGDAVTDALDFLLLADCVNGVGTTSPPVGVDDSIFALADLDLDGDVDLADYGRLQVRSDCGVDFNCDGAVDYDDLVEWFACQASPGQSGQYPWCGACDSDVDGDLDLADFAQFQLTCGR